MYRVVSGVYCVSVEEDRVAWLGLLGKGGVCEDLGERSRW